MKSPLLLVLCVLGAAVGGSTDSPGHYDTIVIGLGSAGATAASELARAGKRVLALEAQGRVGGRVHSVPLGNRGLVELGAEWIMGDQNNRVYDAAMQHNITTIQQEFTTTTFYSDASPVDSALINDLFAQTLFENPPEPPEATGTFITKKVMKYITENKPDLLENQDLITGFLEFANLATDNLEGSNDWNDVTTGGSYEDLGGHQSISWHTHGYKTFFDIMLNTYNGGPGLPNLVTKLDTEVTLITCPQQPSEKVKVQCKDGSTYEADTAIVTVSLGVLKEKHSTLFSPPLPQEKQTAIEKISMGLIGKIILTFDEAWWPLDVSRFAFIWKGADKEKVAAADYWTTRILGAHRPMGSNNSLTLWTSGNVAKEVETLPENTVKTKSVELLQKFMGDTMKITVPQPTGFMRSTWFTNPFTRGTYTYDNMLTAQYPDARAQLGSPLRDAGGPRVLFAGEATSSRHFGCVHGASETGYREAKRLLESNNV